MRAPRPHRPPPPAAARPLAARRALLALALAALGACAVGPDYVRPEPPSAERVSREPLPAATVAADGHAQSFTPGAELPAPSGGSCSARRGWMPPCARRSPAIRPSRPRKSLRQSQDNLRAGYGLFLPQASGEADATRTRSAPLADGAPFPSTIFNVVSVSGTVSYALDIFGGERRTVEALQAQRDSQDYAAKAAYLTITANVVDAVIARAAYQAQIRTTRELIELEGAQLHATEAQVRAGTAATASVLAIAGQLAASRALLAPLALKADQAGHLLATLEGALPASATLPEIELSGLTLPGDLPVSLPADLVRQRPDILAAEAQVHAASANIGVATALMFPSIGLSGTYGVAGASLGSISASSGTFWSVGPSVSVPIFQGGRLWYGRKAAIDAFHGAEDSYRQAVLTAFEQVADALKALEHDAEALQASAEVRRSAAGTLGLLQANVRAGLAANLDALGADIQLHQATLGYLQAVAQRHQDTVALFAALGGGWWNDRHAADGDGRP